MNYTEVWCRHYCSCRITEAREITAFVCYSVRFSLWPRLKFEFCTDIPGAGVMNPKIFSDPLCFHLAVSSKVFSFLSVLTVRCQQFAAVTETDLVAVLRMWASSARVHCAVWFLRGKQILMLRVMDWINTCVTVVTDGAGDHIDLVGRRTRPGFHIDNPVRSSCLSLVLTQTCAERDMLSQTRCERCPNPAPSVTHHIQTGLSKHCGEALTCMKLYVLYKPYLDVVPSISGLIQVSGVFTPQKMKTIPTKEWIDGD